MILPLQNPSGQILAFAYLIRWIFFSSLTYFEQQFLRYYICMIGDARFVQQNCIFYRNEIETRWPKNLISFKRKQDA